MVNGEEDFITIHELKRKPVFKEVTIESGHPEITVENLSGKIEDMGYKVSSYGSSISNDEVADGVKDFKESLIFLILRGLAWHTIHIRELWQLIPDIQWQVFGVMEKTVVRYL